MSEKTMNIKLKLTGLLIISILFLHPGCGKKENPAVPVSQTETDASKELPVLEQNKVASNPMAPGPQEIVFEPVKEETPDAPVETEEDLQEPPRPVGD